MTVPRENRRKVSRSSLPSPLMQVNAGCRNGHPYREVRNLLGRDVARINCIADRDELEETGTPKSPQLPLCLADEIGATHGVAVTPAIRESAASKFAPPKKPCHERRPALASRVRACAICGNS